MSDAFQTHGAPSWLELHTGDVETALKFYTEVLGWEVDAMEMADGSTYHALRLGEARIGGIVPAADGPARWLTYVTVDDVARRTKLAEKGGAAVLALPTSVPEVGTMSTIQDPTGAALCLITYDQS